MTRDLSYDVAFTGFETTRRETTSATKNCRGWVVILSEPLLVTDRDLLRTAIFFETRLFVEYNMAMRFVISITLMYVCIVFLSITMCMYRIFPYLTI